MLTQPLIQTRAATPEEDGLIARHFYQMWLDNQIAESAIAIDWLELTLKFIDQARQSLNYQAFVAEVEGEVVGSAGCQRFAGLYPNIMQATERCDGYIWGVYVEPAYRGRGIATQLTQQTIAYLKAIGCTHAVLNASPSGKPVYSRLGFVDGNLMRLDLQLQLAP
ncbi:GNAT family N-acetyltransferase [Phormidium sp. CLA17]|uniref:GNAT family N-acetyltransferase n=1 Tax=Leptolyngbya sp. Cla-17 TaxID=2803751 RepID=UPI00149238D4|nr:GNAT family N-acetyltransferase [Leptolyngbya sp. Cla-17]MBM0744315.1 GNAT family N-acetyltransferase [Leptolyngbya sp. Cla-17]